MVCCRCCFFCCRTCANALLEPSQQEHFDRQTQQRQQFQQPVGRQPPQQPQPLQRQQPVQQPQAPQRTQSWRSRFSLSSHGSDLPPPYEEGAAGSQSRAPARTHNAPTPKTNLPYAIPLASFMDDTALLDTISKVHTADFSKHGITQEHFLTFYYELDKRLSHQGDGQPGMLNNVMDILRDNTESGQSGADPKVANFLDISNQDIFHPASLHVEVLGSDATKDKVKLSPELEEEKAKYMTKLTKIEEKLAKLARKLDEELVKTSSDYERTQVQAEYDAKRTKLRHKANEVLAEYNQKSDAELYDGLKPSGAASEGGPLWLVVSEKLH